MTIPLQPIAVQQRIVAKVDELFAIYDDLKERLVEAKSLQNQMAVVMVEQVLSI
jgi:type I restriction enzyme, S subunit